MGLQTKVFSLCVIISVLFLTIFSWFYFKSLSPSLLAINEQKIAESSLTPHVFFEQEKHAISQLTQVISLIFSQLSTDKESQPDLLISNLKKIDADWIFLQSDNQMPLFSMLVNPLFSKSSVHDLVQQFQKDYPMLLNKISTEPQTFLILTSEGPALIGMIKLSFKISATISTANLFVCRFIDTTIQNNLQELIPQSNIWPLAQSPLSASQSQLLATFSDYPDGRIITEVDKQKWRSFSALKDISGKPQILLEVIRPRLFDEIIFNAYLFAIFTAFGLMALLLIGLNFAMNKHLYRPLNQILAQLLIWVEKTRIKGDLESVGAHDLEPLTQLINQVIKVINYHQSAALSHAFNDGLNEMRKSFIQEIKRLTKPLITNLNILEANTNDAALSNLETTLTDMLDKISDLSIRATFLHALQDRCNQVRLIQQGHQSKINDTKSKCLHLSTLLQAHTLTFEQTKEGSSKTKTEGA